MSLINAVVEDLVKEDDEKEVKGGLKGRCKEVFDEVVAVEGYDWRHWKEEQKLGQSGWSKATGAMDL
ncbi:hypothetical protein PPACK8108_LOCUS17698 [Phakopsora pachyrhizi]|uniref:Uncharacterized protein n=1 Tax=Phakopsora pachyrhizi TaxID=170000 RepID=A0AAV0BC39_PHAPC|nr:hypothetical protein PPACK8108_LOCUS17698 [Phakopsora pachyrhizi]